MKNLFIVILPAFFWAISDILLRTSSSKINETFGALILSVGMMIIMTFVSIFIAPDILREFSLTNYKHILLALFAGMANAAGVFFFFRFLHQGGTFTQGLPMILVSVVIFGTILGLIFFKDPITIKTGIGLILGIGAIYFLSS